jgi:hypothetical protein
MSKNFILAAALTVASVLFPASAQAGVLLQFDRFGLGSTATTDFAGFDWARGNALAIGGNAAVAAFAGGSRGADTEFTLYYQARLAQLNYGSGDQGMLTGPGGLPIEEYTIVTAFREKVTGIVPGSVGGVTAQFALVAGAPNFLEIYHDATPATLSSNLQGTGFNDGTLVLSANVIDQTGSSFNARTDLAPVVLDGFAGNSYGTGTTTGTLRTLRGTGDSFITANVGFFNSSYFTGLSLAGLNVSFALTSDFETNLALPFGSVDPSARFALSAGGAAPTLAGAGLTTFAGGSVYAGAITGIGAATGNASIGMVNGAFSGTGGPDVQFQADAGTVFNLQIIPEPTSVAVWGIGALALLVGRRRAAKRA